MNRASKLYKKLIKDLLVVLVRNEREINLYIDKLNEMNCFISFGAMPTKQTFPTNILIKFFNLKSDDKQQEIYEKIDNIIFDARDNEIEAKVEELLKCYSL